mmetsp:Transcript_14777/g.31305  ORF Transcript_14777/g.31305 Transcript_14777/m.31305 type:complete len:232 (+) Transcript_14777:377-1072(+)
MPILSEPRVRLVVTLAAISGKLGIVPILPQLLLLLAIDRFIAEVSQHPIFRMGINNLISGEHRPLDGTSRLFPANSRDGLLVMELEPIVGWHAGMGVVGSIGLFGLGGGVVGSVGCFEGGDAVGHPGLGSNQFSQRIMLHLLQRWKEIQISLFLASIVIVVLSPSSSKTNSIGSIVLSLGRRPFSQIRRGDHLVPRAVGIVIDLRGSGTTGIIRNALSVFSGRGIDEGEYF